MPDYKEQPRPKNLSWIFIGLWPILVTVSGFLFWKIFGYGHRLIRQPRLSPAATPAEVENHQSVQTKALRIASANLFAGIEKRRLPDGQEKFVLCAGLRNFREPWARDFGFASFGLVELNEFQVIREGLEEGRRLAGMVATERRLLPVEKQRGRLERGGAVARLHPIDRSRGGLSHSQKRLEHPTDLASETGLGSGPYSGLLPGVRPVEDPGPIVPTGRPGRRTPPHSPGAQGTARGRRHPADAGRNRNPQTVHHQAQRTPGNPPAQTRPAAAVETKTDRNVVKTFQTRPLRGNDLRQQLGKLG